VFDARIAPEWPKQVIDAVEDLRQGDVIPWPADTAYVTTDQHVLYGEPVPETALSTGAQFAVALEPAPELAVITTQTCDIDEQGLPRRKPWIQYAPLAEASDAPRRGLSTWPLDGPELPDGDWYADLRIEGCAEKNVLVGLSLIRGFSSEEKADAFGRHLGHLRARPALANHLVETVTEHLRQFRKAATNGQRKAMRREFVEVRLDITDGSRMKPHAVRLVVLHKAVPTDAMKAWFDEWYDTARPDAAAVGIELHAVHHLDASRLEYVAVKDLIVLDLSG
jgi:hypothetical protein